MKGPHLENAMSETRHRFSSTSRDEKILAFHNSLISSFQSRDLPDYWILSGWSSIATQRSRFERLLHTSSYGGGSVLDWGCGVGDLYGHLCGTGHDFEYRGLDVNPRMITIAEKRFGGLFAQVPISYRLTEYYDYVFASGLFQFCDEEMPQYYIDMLQNMFTYARRAVAVNFLSSLRDDRDKVNYELYLDPNALVPGLERISSRWIVDHSYHPGRADFTVALIRSSDESRWRRPNFSSDHSFAE